MSHSNQTSVIIRVAGTSSSSGDHHPSIVPDETIGIGSPETISLASSLDDHHPRLSSPEWDNCSWDSGHHDFSSNDIYKHKTKRQAIPVPSESKDDAYWERRRRNNESAKRSRETRRLKEVQTSQRITYLEQENVKLQAEVKFLREELSRLRENEFLQYLVQTSQRGSTVFQQQPDIGARACQNRPGKILSSLQ